ncbi:helical backbone metal receptor [Vreelandella azerica]|uniref:helical backbone metal receptor n=1 Tax=Vreelandella azerica TaxID=2732867 RepID=UPI002E2A3EF3|nr:helical backbone metal receptor [Halomonas azerica]
MANKAFTSALCSGLAGLLLAACLPMNADASYCAIDDLGEQLCLEAPAQRIAALSPGATELAFAAGAGEQVVAVVAHSDYPPEAEKLSSVGDHQRIDLEALLSLQPDLVIGWVSGNPPAQLEKLAALGLSVFYLEPQHFEGIASAIERLASLTDSETQGYPAADDFRNQMAALEARYADLEPVSVFYQVWETPLMSVNDENFIGQIISLCGGDNIMGEQTRQVPRLNPEVAIAENPAAIVTGVTAKITATGSSIGGNTLSFQRLPMIISFLFRLP